MIAQIQLDKEILVPIIFVMLGILVGLISEIIIFARLRRTLVKSKWLGIGVFIKSIRGMPLLWFTILGIYGALINSQLSENMVNLGIQLLILILTLSILLVLMRVTGGIVTLYAGKTEGGLIATSIVTNITNFIFLLLGFLIIVQSLGIEITPLITLLGVGGLTIALALQPTLSNFFAGIYILISREFSVGDYIKLDSGDEGYITDIDWIHTIIQPPARFKVVIPNNKLSNAIVTNYGVSTKEHAIIIPIGVSYDSDLNHVEKVTIEVALKTVNEVQGETPSTVPYIRYHTFAPSSIDFNVNIYTKNLRDRAIIKHEFIKRLFARYKLEKIDIPYPTSVIYSRTEKSD